MGRCIKNFIKIGIGGLPGLNQWVGRPSSPACSVWCLGTGKTTSAGKLSNREDRHERMKGSRGDRPVAPTGWLKFRRKCRGAVCCAPMEGIKSRRTGRGTNTKWGGAESAAPDINPQKYLPTHYGRSMTNMGEVQVSQSAGMLESPLALSTETVT